MNVNKYKAKLISYILCLSMVSGNFLTANAAETQTAKDNYVKSSDSNYSVIVPKTITLDGSRHGEYSVTVTGDIPCSKRVYVSPVDGIDATEKMDFYMKDQTTENGKTDVAATITQNKVYWNHEEVSNAYKETGSVNADGLSAGTWKGTFEIAINLLDDPDHEHQYTGKITKEPTCTEEGEKTYTCECGDSYTEKIPPTGHSYVDGECEHCGEKDPNHHNWKPLWFEVSELPSTKTADAYTSSAGQKQSASDDLTITIPEWYPTDIAYTYDYTYQFSGYTFGSVKCGSFSTYRNGYSISSTASGSGSKEMILGAGDNVITVSAQCTSDSNNGSGIRRALVRGTFPALDLDKTQHYCPHCQVYEDHYSTCTDPAKDEYYFCEKCGLQFRHRCKFDEAQTAVAECTGGYSDLLCVDDYYDTEHKLFDTCGQTSSIYFEGLGHDWKPYVVEIDPIFNTAVSDADSSYKFVESGYGYTGTIGTAKNKSNSTAGTLYIKLPDNFIGTYTLPISYSISSSSFTKTGYQMNVTCTNYYDYEDGADITSGKSKSYLNYSLAYASTSVGTTSGTLNVELHPGNNTIRFGASASVNISTWSTYTGSVRFSTPTMPHSIFNGKEVHKCSRCNIEESHTDKIYEIERKEATCIADGYIRYTCDDCHFIYDEILPKHPDDHADVDHDYICDDCGKDIKPCEEFGHLIEHIQKTYQIPMNFSVKPNSGWYLDEDGYYNIKLKAQQLYSDEWIKITYSVPYDFPGTYYLRQGNYVVVHNSNGGQWSYESTASTGLQTGGPYSSSGDVPLTLKPGTCSIEISCFALDKFNSETHFTIAKKSSLSVSVDLYHCTRCGRTETYNFGNEISTQSVSDSELYFDDIASETNESQSINDDELYIDDIVSETDETQTDEQQTVTDENKSSDKYVIDTDKEDKMNIKTESSDKDIGTGEELG